MITAMRAPEDLMKRYPLKTGTAMFCGTLAVQGEIAPAEVFEMEIEDPVLGRKLSHSYIVQALPIIS